MSKRVDDNLISLAYDVVALKGKDHRIGLCEGSDYQGELHLAWNGHTFEAYLTVFSDPHTSYGGYYDPPETTWREEEDDFEAVKIRDVSDWLKQGWGFDLA